MIKDREKIYKQTFLHGCISGWINENTVKCLLLIDEKQHEVLFPQKLFIDAGIKVEEGAAFTAEFEVVDGVKSLVLSSCPPRQNPESKLEIYDFLARL